HVFTPNDPLTRGDGVGPVFNKSSCVACHYQGGTGGSGKLEENVTTYLKFEGSKVIGGTLHADAISDKYREWMDQIEPGQPHTSRPTLEHVNGKGNNFGRQVVFSQRNTPALFGAKLIDEISDRDILAIARWQRAQSGMVSSDNDS